MTVTIGRRELLAALGGAAAWPLAARGSASLSLDICGPDHLAPGPDFNLDPLREFLWRARDRIISKRYQAFPHVRLANDRDDFAIEQRDDLLWRSGRD
jgi:hypothetical protein